MDNLIVLLASVAISAIGGLIAIIVARKKGLPDINREIEERLTVLNKTLEDQLTQNNVKYDDLSEQFTTCKTKLDESFRENARLTRRLRLAEADLLELYRGQNKKPPDRLIHPDDRD